MSEQESMSGVRFFTLAIVFLILVTIVGSILFHMVDRAQKCEDAGGFYKAIENRCVVSLTEIEVDV